jgi:ABC-2 type transport system permease protein
LFFFNMRKVLFIAWNEFSKNVFRRRFLGTLMLPLFILAIAVVVGFVTASSMMRFQGSTVGVVDPNRQFGKAPNPPEAQFNFSPYPDEAAAQRDLNAGKIMAYLTLSPEHESNGLFNVSYLRDQPDADDLIRAFRRYRNANLLASQPPEVAARVTQGPAFTYETPDAARQTNDENLPSFILPMVLSIFFILALFGGAQYLMQAVLDEKENRTMEVVITSITPTQLMAGKVLGLGGVGLLQMGIWLIAAAIALALLQPRFPFLADIRIEPAFIALALVLFALEYFILGALMAAIGSMVVDPKQGQNYSAPITLIAMLPLFFLVPILFNPNGILAVALSLFPLTSPLTLMIRYGMTSVPAWQIGLAIVLLIATAFASIWVAGKIFRIGMLRFDTGVKWSEVAANIKF